MIKHQINDHAGNGNIQPHWQSPARNGAVTQEVSAQGATQSDDDKWHDDDCENGMCCQDREIDWARDSLPGKARRAVMLVINNVRNEKQYRGRERGKLTTLVREHSATTNKKVTGCQEKETGSVKRGVEMRKDAVEIGKQKAEGRRQEAESRRQKAGGRKRH